MKRIITYGFYMAAAAVLLMGCLKDGVEVPAVTEAPQLVLSIPETQEVAVTRAATTNERWIYNLYVLVYRTGSLAYKQAIAGAMLTSNGTAAPSVSLNYRVQTGDVVYVVANCGTTIKAKLDALGTGAAVSGLSALLAYDNPAYTTKLQPSSGMPMFGTLTWSSGTNTCQMARSMAKVTVSAASGLFSGKNLKYAITGAPEKTSMEVTVSGTDGNRQYAIPNVVSIGGSWSMDIDAGDIIASTAAHYCAPYPVSTAAGSGVTLDKNTFDNRRTALILSVAGASGAEYYRLDFSEQKTVTTPTGTASNEYMDIAPNTHYTFNITSVKSRGYRTPLEARNNPGSNIEYTVTISDSEWKSATSNGQYLIKTDRDTVWITNHMSEVEDLLKFACQMPDSGQKPGSELPGSVTTCVVSVVNSATASASAAPFGSMIQLHTSDGIPTGNNTIDLSGTTVPANGYQLKYIVPGPEYVHWAGYKYVRVSYGNIDHFVPLACGEFDVSMSPTDFTSDGGSTTLRVLSYNYTGDSYTRVPLPWTAEFSTDGGATWSKERPAMLPDFPTEGPGSEQASYDDYTITVAPQTGVVSDSHNAALREAATVSNYDLSTENGSKPQSTANCYVVNAPGTYTFPLVYGNAITENRICEEAYTAEPTGSAYMLEKFVNHLNQPILDPYIYNNENCTPGDACLVWQDTQGLVQNIALSSDGHNITFEVPAGTIRQGNAIIAVRDASGTIMWSWHIWVTDYKLGTDLKTVMALFPLRQNQYQFMPVNLGWCDPEVTSYAGRSVQVRLTQAKSGASRIFTLNQAGKVVPNSPGNQPYFQFGRKDPMLPGVLNASGESVDKSCYYENSNYQFYGFSVGKATIGRAIQSPNRFFNNGSSNNYTPPFDWCNASGTASGKQAFFNLWNTNNDQMLSGTMNGNPIIKTIYDPSPAGYHLPAPNAFTGFTYSGGAIDTDTDFRRYNSPYTSVNDISTNFGWTFYCNTMTGQGSTIGEHDPSGGTIFFPIAGYRDGGVSQTGSNDSGRILSVGTYSRYWTAGPSTSRDQILSMELGSPFVNPVNYLYRVNGYVVRPVKQE